VDHWFNGDSGANPELLADAEAYNLVLPDEAFEQRTYGVWPENQATVQLFLRCQTQWRAVGSGVIGLDYGVALSLATLSGAADPLRLLDDLQVMELRARELINKEASRGHES